MILNTPVSHLTCSSPLSPRICSVSAVLMKELSWLCGTFTHPRYMNSTSAVRLAGDVSWRKMAICWQGLFWGERGQTGVSGGTEGKLGSVGEQRGILGSVGIDEQTRDIQ